MQPPGSNPEGGGAAIVRPSQTQITPDTNNLEDLSRLYDEAYYRTGLGNIPYERNDYWLGFFAGIAEEIARSLAPRKVLDAGCAMGFLVESLWARGIEAWGIDISSYAISKVRPDIASYCRQATLIEPVSGSYDLVTCIEVLEHIPSPQTAQVLRNLTSITGTILFSSTPSDFDEPTHVNVRPPLYWLRAFAECGFQPDLSFDAGFLTPHAFVLRKGPAISEDSLILFSRMLLNRCVLASKDNECRALRKQNAGIQNQLESLAMRNQQLAGELPPLQQQCDSLRNSLREAESERDAARNELRQVAGRLLEQERLAAEASGQNRALTGRLGEMREQHAAANERILQLTRAHRAVDTQLRTILESPGWRFIERYRGWLNRNIAGRPWLRKSYEPVVWWLLRHFSGQRSRDARRTAQPDTSPPADTGDRIPEAARAGLTYEEWIGANEPDLAALAGQRTRALTMPSRPLISVVVPVYRVALPMLRACVQSVLDQTYDHWELCIVHAAREAVEQRAFLAEIAAGDSRLKLVLLDENGGISANSNRALELATGEFVALLDHDDTLAPFALYEVANLLAISPELDVIYSDHDYIDETGSRRFDPLFKPDWSPDIMLSANYITHLTVLRRSLVRKAGGFAPAMDGAQDWDLFFKATEQTNRIGHIPRVLYHWRTHASSTALNTAAKDYAPAAQLHSIQAHLDRLKIPARAETAANGLLHIRWLLPAQRKRVSIIVPSKDKVELLSRLIETLRSLTRYENFEILVVDNGSVETATHRYYEKLRQMPDVRVLEYSRPFNYSAMNNLGARKAGGDLLLFLNNDMEVVAPEWLEELAGWMELPAVGAVGARLLRPNRLIQHAGVVVGFEGFAGHPFADLPALTFNIYGSTGWYRNYLAVTGACLMMRRDVFEQIGGFDEHFISCGSDVEICLRAREHGYRVVYNPFAELLHYECQTRKGDVPSSDYKISFRHYQPYLLNGDPYWNPNLSLTDRTIGFRRADEPTALASVQDFLRKLDAAGSPDGAEPRPASLASSEEQHVVEWFDHTSADLQASRELMASIRGYRPVRKMVWFIPPFEHAFYGGIFTILRFAEGWSREQGVTHHFAICGSGSREQMAERIRAIHPACTAESVSILATPDDAGDLAEADACVATLWTTAYYALKFRKAPRKFYFIQDYEPMFYRAGSASALVDNTYRLGFYGIANTISLAQVYEREYGAKAAYFTPCVDLAVFHPPASAVTVNARKWRLFCYARPQHARNAFELLIAALRIVQSHLGGNLQILCAGSPWKPSDYGLEGVVENLGLLTYEQTAELYRTCHAGAVLMLTRHPSYIPLELMASGCLVITNRNHWTEWLLRDEENCLLSNTTASCLAETIERGLTDHALRQRITSAALTLVREQYSNWEAQIARIYGFLCDPEG